MNQHAPPPIDDLLADFAAGSRIDGVTLWVAQGTELVATCNPLEPAVPGLRQPLARGIISQVYLTGIGMIESAPAANPAHDATVDRHLGKRTTAIMAAPVDFGPHGDGVLSAVRHEGGQPGHFGLADLAALERLAASLAGRECA
jgi:hypothetical protein